MSLLRVENLSLGLANSSDFLVKNLSFVIEKGETVAVVGESGSGKTLSSLALMQLLPETMVVSSASKIIFAETNLLNISELQMRKVRGAKIAMIFQDAMSAFTPVIAIGAQLDEVIRLHIGGGFNSRKQRALQLLKEVGIKDELRVYNSYVHQLSGGMRQRAMIAMALAAEPELLIADEPSTALDVTIQAQVIELLKDLQQKHNMSILFISHDLAVVQQVAHKVVVMRHGECVEQAAAKDFFHNPQHEYTKQLLKDIPDVNTEVLTKPEYCDEVLQIKSLQQYFPVKKGIFKRKIADIKAVDGVDFAIMAGHTLAIVGESGSGKNCC